MHSNYFASYNCSRYKPMTLAGGGGEEWGGILASDMLDFGTRHWDYFGQLKHFFEYL